MRKIKTPRVAMRRFLLILDHPALAGLNKINGDSLGNPEVIFKETSIGPALAVNFKYKN